MSEVRRSVTRGWGWGRGRQSSRRTNPLIRSVRPATSNGRRRDPGPTPQRPWRYQHGDGCPGSECVRSHLLHPLSRHSTHSGARETILSCGCDTALRSVQERPYPAASLTQCTQRRKRAHSELLLRHSAYSTIRHFLSVDSHKKTLVSAVVLARLDRLL